jgi:hypothetical protein
MDLGSLNKVWEVAPLPPSCPPHPTLFFTRDFLARIAAIVEPICLKRKWRVKKLTELHPGTPHPGGGGGGRRGRGGRGRGRGRGTSVNAAAPVQHDGDQDGGGGQAGILLGLNVNRGQKISLRLFSPSGAPTAVTALPFESVLDTMLHELAHMEVGPHDKAFHDLWDALRAECETNLRNGTPFIHNRCSRACSQYQTRCRCEWEARGVWLHC